MSVSLPRKTDDQRTDPENRVIPFSSQKPEQQPNLQPGQSANTLSLGDERSLDPQLAGPLPLRREKPRDREPGATGNRSTEPTCEETGGG